MPSAPYTIPGLPNGGSLPAYTGASIDQAVAKVVETIQPLMVTALPFVIGYVLLMWLVDYVLDHLPWGGTSGGGPGSIVSEDEFGMIVNTNRGYVRMRRT